MNSDLSKNPCWPCANCCTGTVVRIRESDIARWKKEERFDILMCIEEISPDAVFMIHKKNDECIFLDKKGCLIYDARPEVCRLYPASRSHADKFYCKLKDVLFKKE
jgi:Fe-S-cluster containining protein